MLNEDSKEKDSKELKEKIAKWYNSSVYHKLSNRLQQTDFFTILGVSRKELQHSKFIAWLLNPNETHDLGEFPLRKFLQLLAIRRKEDYNLSSEFPENLENSFILGNYKINESIKISTEETFYKGKNKKNRLDIFIKDLSIEIKNNKEETNIFILIENKVESKESKGQTQKYYDWAKHDNNTDKCEQENTPKGTPICVFLHPSDKSECNKFINITYKDLVNMVIEPCLLKTNSDKTIFYIKEYLKTLSYSPENTKILVMAFSKEERELCQAFFEENRELLNYIIREKSKDKLCEDFFEVNKKILTYIREVLNANYADDYADDYTDDDFEALSDFIKKKDPDTKDYTKYSFNKKGKYNKRRLALKIFQEASEQYNTLDELKKVFQEVLKLHGIKKENFITNDMKQSTWAEKDYEKRFFTNPDEQIKLGNERYFLTKHWGKGADFDKLLDIARNTLKFDIKEIK